MTRRPAREGRGVAFQARSELRLHLYLKGTETLVGIAGLQDIDWDVPKFEIGYWCRTSFTGHGYTTEAVRAITLPRLRHPGRRTGRDSMRPPQTTRAQG